jgi:tRNA nucleotidyltransferase/poly(A) polymerase
MEDFMKLSGVAKYYFLLIFTFIFEYIEGHPKNKSRLDKFSHPIVMEENAKEMRHLYKKFPAKKYYRQPKNGKQFYKQSQFTQKKLSTRALNRPFTRYPRSRKIGTVPLHKLPNANQ